MSTALDNLTTTIVMVALLRKLIDKQQYRWFMAAMVVMAANAGGAWSPIGDVTTIMLWIGGLLFVPVFKTVTHLSPYLGMLFSLSIIWITTEIMHRRRAKGMRAQLVVSRVLRKVDTPTILFFLGILTAVSALQSAGHLHRLRCVFHG